ncbi:hypothetical protein KY290_001748 [Solanum tuberosum]|uniref:Uncharacterized protein n=1 Tax=Solanum tuberosum TaxID=4113 RepID=A0ABQ7WNL9_SOLTU|nr:hypothetical protein KY290_001748 [Solanum tuberosum]
MIITMNHNHICIFRGYCRLRELTALSLRFVLASVVSSIWLSRRRLQFHLRGYCHRLRERFVFASEKKNPVCSDGSWTNVAGGVKKGKVYGLGAQPSSCHPSPLLSGASTSQTLEEMEVMRREISKLTERLQTSEANYVKVQKFMEKHMVKSDDGEEETDSDEE